MSEQDPTKEERILAMVKNVLTSVAKDTAPQPGLRHPLSEHTVQGIRECLMLITARERELARELGRDTSARPRYIDEPRSEVVVPLDFAPVTKGPKKEDE
ncbi:MAG: segregation and condensation protein A [Thiogranum sp.]